MIPTERLKEIERTSSAVEDGIYTILSDDLHSMAVELLALRAAPARNELVERFWQSLLKRSDVEDYGIVTKGEIASLVTSARLQALEEAAKLVEEHQIFDSSDGQGVEPRSDGNRAGLAYAAAIRALAQEKV